METSRKGKSWFGLAVLSVLVISLAILTSTDTFAESWDDSATSSTALLAHSSSSSLLARSSTDSRLPASIGNLGDSITAGALASFKRQHFAFPWVQVRLVAKILNYGASRDMEAIEDRKLSWAGGMDKRGRVYSHAHRLSAIAGQKRLIPTANVSFSGAESQDLESQLADLNLWSEENFDQAYPDYVTMMIGPNDICADSAADMVSTVDFYANVSETVDEVLSTSPKSKILVGSLPNIESLRAVAANANLHVGLKCEDLWNKINLCPTLTSISDPYQRSQVARRVIDYNNALNDLVASRAAAHGDRVRFADETYKIPFTSKDLSLDCFHPNVDGQAKLAEVTFRDSWWAQAWPETERRLADEKRRKQKCRKSHKGPSKVCR